MTIARLTGQDAKGTSATASVSATYAATPRQNNLLIATVTSNKNSGTNTLTGWTPAQDRSFSGATGSVTIFYKVAGAGEATAISATAASATVMRLHIYEYSGCVTASPLDTSNFSQNASSTVNSCGAVTPSVNNALVFGTVASSANATNPSWLSTLGFTGLNLRQVDAANIRLWDGDLIQVGGAGTSITPAGTENSAVITTGEVAVFKPLVISSSTLMTMGVG